MFPGMLTIQSPGVFQTNDGTVQPDDGVIGFFCCVLLRAVSMHVQHACMQRGSVCKSGEQVHAA